MQTMGHLDHHTVHRQISQWRGFSKSKNDRQVRQEHWKDILPKGTSGVYILHECVTAGAHHAQLSNREIF